MPAFPAVAGRHPIPVITLSTPSSARDSRSIPSIRDVVMTDAHLESHTGSETSSDFDSRGVPSTRGLSLTNARFGALPDNDRTSQRRLADYKLVRKFKRSGEGQAKLFRARRASELMVVKTVGVMPKANGKLRLPDEVKTLKLLRRQHQHPNIIVWHGYEMDRRSRNRAVCHLKFEYCSGGDLQDYCKGLIKTQTLAAPLFVLHFIVSMADALAYLHLGYPPPGTGTGHHNRRRYQPIIHCDIKPANIFLRSPGSNTYGMPDIVLGDFGLACLEHESYDTCGTRGYFPPEVKRAREDLENADAQQGVQTRASDIYTFGATLYSLAFAHRFDNSAAKGFDGHEPPELVELFYATKLDPFIVLEIMEQCFAEHPTDRITTGELYDIAAEMKRVIAGQYARGARWTDTSAWPSHWRAQRAAMASISPTTSASAESTAPTWTTIKR